MDFFRSLLGLLVVFLLGTGMVVDARDLSNPPDTLHFEKPSPESGDSIEYELIILDFGFESWFTRVHRPEGFYSKAYLENWNRRLVQQWNGLIGAGTRSACTPETYLNYDLTVDYGLTLNHRLFYYFRYANEKCRLFSSYPRAWD